MSHRNCVDPGCRTCELDRIDQYGPAYYGRPPRLGGIYEPDIYDYPPFEFDRLGSRTRRGYPAMRCGTSRLPLSALSPGYTNCERGRYDHRLANIQYAIPVPF